MKKCIFNCALLILLVACSKTPGYKVSGNIADKNGVIYLKHKVDGEWIKIDSTDLVNGMFSFEGSVKSPEQFQLALKEDKRKRISFIVENTEIFIKSDSADVEITGSVAQNILDKYSKIIELFDKKDGELNQQYWEAKDANNAVLIDEILAKHQEVQKNRLNAVAEFIKKNNKSFASVVIVSQLTRGKDADFIDAQIAVLDTSLLNTDLIVEVKEYSQRIKNVAIGKKAPNFTMNNTEGKAVTLYSLIGKGYLLIDFWASWCSPCRDENPNVLAAYDEYHDKGFEIIGVSYDEKKEDWEKAIRYDNLPWIHVSDLKGWGNLTGKLYNISSIPSNILLDREGIIIAKNLRGEKLRSKLEELFN
jgi:peroxiredoxin